jgi:hypothetical protein
MTHAQPSISPEILHMLHVLPLELSELALELRSLILNLVPDATEHVHRKGFTYFFSERGGPVSAGICQIGLHPDHVRLAFIHGVFLPDPERLLQGPAEYKRFVKLHSRKEVRRDVLADLILASARFDPRTLGEA